LISLEKRRRFFLKPEKRDDEDNEKEKMD